MEESSTGPKLVYLFSGKRKSGKDYITDILKERLGDEAVIVRLSGQLKECYAQDNGLDYEKLLSAGEYKEKYRLDMLKWSEEIRNKDYAYFCRAAISKYDCAKFPIWIISDARRSSDLKYFRENYGDSLKTVRIEAPEDVRSERGWKFTAGVDDRETECGLDDVQDWDYRLVNDGSKGGEEMIRDLELMAKHLTE